jgi:uncharacterized protein (TIGR02271 family)
MALYKLHDLAPSIRDNFNGDEIKGLDVYTQAGDDKIGSVQDALVDENGRFRYLIVDTGFWVFGKKIMLPVGLSRIDYNDHRVYVNLSKDQVENLPEFTEDLKIDRQYEEQVRDVYHPTAATTTDSTYATSPAAAVDTNSSYATSPAAAVDPAAIDPAAVAEPRYPADYPTTASVTEAAYPTNDADTHFYNQNSALFETNEQDHQPLRLYEERLLANKNRVKTGEVAVGKRVETDTQRVSIPLEKERVVVERTTPADAGTAVSSDAASFQEGEVARIDVYEEVADVRKEAFVREEVQVRKEVNQETANVEDTIRREELNVDTDGNPVVDRNL